MPLSAFWVLILLIPPRDLLIQSVSAPSCPEDECLNAKELHVCVQRLKRDKSPGIDSAVQK